jgi:hypothetical protein
MQTQTRPMGHPNRRATLVWLAASAWPLASRADDAAALLRAGGCVLMMRHASTVPGVGDPPEFQLGNCSTQRNLSTAGQADERHTPWPALNSSFGDRYPAVDASATLREALRAVPAGQFEVWVTHQVNITAITGAVPAQAEGYVLDRQAKLLLRSRFDG